jgi:hypothetical protein
VTRIGELGATLAVTSNRHTLRRNTWSMRRCWFSESSTASQFAIVVGLVSRQQEVD